MIYEDDMQDIALTYSAYHKTCTTASRPPCSDQLHNAGYSSCTCVLTICTPVLGTQALLDTDPQKTQCIDCWTFTPIPTVILLPTLPYLTTNEFR